MVRRIVRDPPAEARQGVRDVQNSDGVPIRPLAIVRIAKGHSVFLVEGALRLMGGQARPDGWPAQRVSQLPQHVYGLPVG